MPSDKCNSIMAVATGLIFHCSMLLVLRHAFLPTTAAPMLASWFYQSLPLFSFVLHSFLQHRKGDDLRYVHYGFSTRLGKCSTSKDASYAVIYLECYPCVWSSWHHDWVAHQLLNWWVGHTLNVDKAFRIFRYGWIDCRDAFRAVLHLQNCVMGWKISECEVYWLTNFLLIKNWAHVKKEICSMH